MDALGNIIIFNPPFFTTLYSNESVIFSSLKPTTLLKPLYNSKELYGSKF